MAPKPNGFLMFMLQFKKREEKRGRIFKGGLKEVQVDPQCSREWQLTKAQKDQFTKLAKESKQEVKKKTGIGELMDDLQRAKQMEIDFKSKMTSDMEEIVAAGMELGDLHTRKFYFIHANWYHTRSLESGEFDYIPAEFAIAEFSLELGVTGIYHKIIKTEIMCGFTREAIETSQETHQIPWDLATAEDNFQVMCDGVLKFLKRDKSTGRFPPLYTSRKISGPVKSLLRRLMDSKNLMDDTFIAYDLEELFSRLHNAAEDDGAIKIVQAECELIKDIFSFTPGLDCEFHKTLDGTSQFCSESNVKRWAFTICDNCCEKFGIKMLEGVHYPKKVAIETELLATHFNQMMINDTLNMKSMTGVSNKYRKEVSERTAADEIRRRNEKTPITVIDFAKNSVQKLPAPAPVKPAPEPDSIPEEYQRPLRLPKTSSTIAKIVGVAKEPAFSDTDFPSLGVSAGRGRNSRSMKENKPGRGRGIVFQ